MKEFDTITINKQKHVGFNGSYNRQGDVLQIEAENSDVKNLFSDLMRDGIFVNDIEFENEDEFLGAFSGPYHIGSIHDYTITMTKP